eukprot:CAMPEP_0167752120 /NCGR_PEP_ID=MMETSP0110_2-20121227/6954_1 /TAXON_ID=629695 /ORGANISM="Gymnochlora sp., Strain CCMP2014" /LENGTH=726 /DNA_ID=CAMNT_0007637685 /DNA_START=152 /DNA_END=2332 /DNA_ORIENTATION=-
MVFSHLGTKSSSPDARRKDESSAFKLPSKIDVSFRISRPGVMSRVGFSTAFASYCSRQSLCGLVCKAYLVPEKTIKAASPARVLVFFREESDLEMMMADASSLPTFASAGQRATLRGIKPLRKGIQGLKKHPTMLARQVSSDIQRARIGSGSKQLRPEISNNASLRLDATTRFVRYSEFRPGKGVRSEVPSPQIGSVTSPGRQQPLATASVRPHHRVRSYSVQHPVKSVSKKRSERKSLSPTHRHKPSEPVSSPSTKMTASEQFAKSVYVSRIPPNADWMQIATAFRPVGPTLRVYRKPRQSWAHVYFANMELVQAAVRLGGQGRLRIGSSVLNVKPRERPSSSERRMKRVIKTVRAFFGAADILDKLLATTPKEDVKAEQDQPQPLSRVLHPTKDIRFGNTAAPTRLTETIATPFMRRSEAANKFSSEIENNLFSKNSPLARSAPSHPRPISTPAARQFYESKSSKFRQNVWGGIDVVYKGDFVAPSLPVVSVVRSTLSNDWPAPTEAKPYSNPQRTHFGPTQQQVNMSDSKLTKYQLLVLENSKKVENHDEEAERLRSDSEKGSTNRNGAKLFSRSPYVVPTHTRKTMPSTSNYTPFDSISKARLSKVNRKPSFSTVLQRKAQVSPSFHPSAHEDFAKRAQENHLPASFGNRQTSIKSDEVITFSRKAMLSLRTEDRAVDLPDLSRLFSNKLFSSRILSHVRNSNSRKQNLSRHEAIRRHSIRA